jgi:two-component sensor histidine kinase
MLIKRLLGILFLFPCITVSLHTTGIDSLKRELKSEIRPSVRLQLLLSLAQQQIESVDHESVYTSETAFHLADSMHLEFEQAKAQNLLGVAWKIWGDNEQSILCLFRALDIYKKLNRQNERAEVLMNIGETNRAAANLDKSMSYLNRALDIFLKNNDSAGLGKVYDRLAATSFEIFMNNLWAKENAHQPLDFESLPFQKVYSSDSSFRQKYDVIVGYANLSRAYAERLSLLPQKISTENIFAALYTVTHQYEKAVKVFDAVFADIRASNSMVELPVALHNYGALHFQRKDYGNALLYAKEGFRIAQEQDVKSYILLCADLLSLVYQAQGNYTEAIRYLRLACSGREKYYQKDIDIKMRVMQFDFEMKKKQKEIESRNHLVWALIISMGTIIMVTSVFVIVLVKKSKKTSMLNQSLKKKNLIITEQNVQLETVNAEKELILKEVHHRIKNNMATIMSLLSLQAGTLTVPSAVAALKDARSRIEAMMVLYDKLFRSSGFEEISVREYLPALIDQIVGNFPENGSVTVGKHIDDFMLEAKSLSTLGIILNELFTNIMKHAFSGRDDGVITVCASLNNNTVSLVIQDNGIGMPQSVDLEHPTGFGLTLVTMLMKQLGGTARMERENGTRVILEFPK